MDDFYCVVTFHITQHALIFESFMKEKGLEVKLMPVPRQVSSSCGTAARVSCDVKDKILEWCEDEGLVLDSFHKIKNESGRNWFSKYLNK